MVAWFVGGGAWVVPNPALFTHVPEKAFSAGPSRLPSAAYIHGDAHDAHPHFCVITPPAHTCTFFHHRPPNCMRAGVGELSNCAALFLVLAAPAALAHCRKRLARLSSKHPKSFDSRCTVLLCAWVACYTDACITVPLTLLACASVVAFLSPCCASQYAQLLS